MSLLSSKIPYQEFRFPKPASQPEPTWCPGDGFSDDEVKPDFAFLMTGKRKRKRSRSLSAFGQLSLETENTGNDSAAGATSGQLHLRGSHGYGGRARRTEVKDLWPTRENFAEHSIAKKPRNAGVRNHGTIESTPPFNPRCPPMSKPQTKQAMPRKRQVSDFENFGKRKGKPRSCHREGPSLKSTPVSQGYVSEVSDEENNEDRGGLYEQAGHESEQQSVADEELEDIRMTVHELESNDNGSVRLGEDNSDDEDENMQNTISDSQPEEVPSSKFGIGERLEAYLTNLARRSLSNYEATAENTTLDSQVDKAPSSSFDVGEGPQWQAPV
ncbi:hypothetical protein E0Z10_g9932 [Xylaria hypoxylon]|uniref:Uncharacterized protein n=1 Tax=Xylaria hypoxylon TaxID=37992 RepID=A0A4Z0Y446_9PEZI|nr:hypothetical protein E0Z10_g9932 [Xylaria hypoxylon]